MDYTQCANDMLITWRFQYDIACYKIPLLRDFTGLARFFWSCNHHISIIYSSPQQWPLQVCYSVNALGATTPPITQTDSLSENARCPSLKWAFPTTVRISGRNTECAKPFIHPGEIRKQSVKYVKTFSESLKAHSTRYTRTINNFSDCVAAEFGL